MVTGYQFVATAGAAQEVKVDFGASTPLECSAVECSHLSFFADNAASVLLVLTVDDAAVTHAGVVAGTDEGVVIPSIGGVPMNGKTWEIPPGKYRYLHLVAAAGTVGANVFAVLHHQNKPQAECTTKIAA